MILSRNTFFLGSSVILRTPENIQTKQVDNEKYTKKRKGVSWVFSFRRKIELLSKNMDFFALQILYNWF